MVLWNVSLKEAEGYSGSNTQTEQANCTGKKQHYIAKKLASNRLRHWIGKVTPSEEQSIAGVLFTRTPDRTLHFENNAQYQNGPCSIARQELAIVLTPLVELSWQAYYNIISPIADTSRAV